MKYSCKTLCLRYCFAEVRVLIFSINDAKKSYEFRELFLSLGQNWTHSYWTKCFQHEYGGNDNAYLSTWKVSIE